MSRFLHKCDDVRLIKTKNVYMAECATIKVFQGAGGDSELEHIYISTLSCDGLFVHVTRQSTIVDSRRILRGMVQCDEGPPRSLHGIAMNVSSVAVQPNTNCTHTRLD